MAYSCNPQFAHLQPLGTIHPTALLSAIFTHIAFIKRSPTFQKRTRVPMHQASVRCRALHRTLEVIVTINFFLGTREAECHSVIPDTDHGERSNKTTFEGEKGRNVVGVTACICAAAIGQE